MNFLNSSFQIAGPEDSPGILNLLEDNPFEGRISLIYTRRPDSWESFMREGDEVMLVVDRNQAQERLDGMAACAINNLYLKGKPAKIAYLFGLRLRKEAISRIMLLPRGYRHFLNRLLDKGVRYAYTTVLEENTSARRMLEKRRPSMPVYDYAGDYDVFTLTPGGRGRLPTGYRFRQAGQEDETILLEFLNREGSRYLFFPFLKAEGLHSGKTTPLLEDFYILEDRNREILAAGAIWDQRDYKQYILKGYRGLYRWIYPIHPLIRLFGYDLCRPGTILSFFTLSCFAAKGGEPEYFHYLLKGIRSVGCGFVYFVVGLHRRHPFQEVVRRRPNILYRSRLYLVYEEGKMAREEIIGPNDIPYLECGRL